MQHGLAVKADDVDFFRVEAVALDEGLNRGAMAGGNHRFGRGKRAGAGGRSERRAASAMAARSSARSSSA